MRSVSIQGQFCHSLIRLFRHLMHLTRVKSTFKSLFDIYRPKYISWELLNKNAEFDNSSFFHFWSFLPSAWKAKVYLFFRWGGDLLLLCPYILNFTHFQCFHFPTSKFTCHKKSNFKKKLNWQKFFFKKDYKNRKKHLTI